MLMHDTMASFSNTTKLMPYLDAQEIAMGTRIPQPLVIFPPQLPYRQGYAKPQIPHLRKLRNGS
jgi:hypothetical protein